MSISFGKLEKINDVKPLFENFVKMRTKFSSPAAFASLKQDEVANRYFTTTDVFFVFDKKSLMPLLNRIDDDDAIVLYPGIRTDEHGPGRPTMIVTAYKKTVNNVYTLSLATDGTGHDTTEQSGGGGKNPSGVGIIEQILDLIPDGEIHNLLESSASV